MNQEIKRLNKLITKHQATIRKIQDACPHPKETLVYQNKGDTGNWCPQDDSYWAEYTCYECGKFWHGDQGEWDGIDVRSTDYKILMKKLEGEQ